MKPAFIIIVLLCACPTLHFGQSIFHVQAERDSVQIGEPIEIELKLTYSAALGKVVWPHFKEDSSIGSNYEIWNVGDIKKDNSVNENEALLNISQKLTVTTFETGYIPFTPIQVIIDQDTIESNAFLITVSSFKIDTSKAFIDIKPVFEDPLTNWEEFTFWIGNNWWWLAIVIVVITVGLFFVFRKKSKLPEPEVIISIYEKYSIQYQELMDKALWTNGKVKEHYHELTGLIRSYYLDRFNVSTFEKTTNEIVAITRTISLPKESQEDVIQVFAISEYVKYAKQIPSVYEIEKHNKATIELIEVTQIKEEIMPTES